MTDLQDALDEYARRALEFGSTEEYLEYSTLLERQHELISNLRNDLELAEVQQQADEDDQFLRRTVVRTLFAMVEGAIFALKARVLTEHRARRFLLRSAEYAVLAEEGYDLTRSGEIRAFPSYPKLKRAVKFTFPIHARALGGHFEFDPPLANDPGWCAFCQSIKIRNRLTHPKCPDDLEVEDCELREVMAGAGWFERQLDRSDEIGRDWLGSVLSNMMVEAFGDESGHAALGAIVKLE